MQQNIHFYMIAFSFIFTSIIIQFIFTVIKIRTTKKINICMLPDFEGMIF